MPDDRSRIIIKEINYWKDHNLLPSAYCDFLLALYTHGEGASIEKRGRSKSMLSIYVTLLLPLIPLSIVVLYTTQFHLILQIGLLSLFLIFAIWCYVIFKKHQYYFTNLALSTVLIFILLISLHVNNTLITLHQLTPFIIITNSIGWLIIGRKFDFKYLTAMGSLALAFTCIYIIF